MIHYHGGPITPQSVAIDIWTARHACISFAHPEQLPIAAEVCQSFILDNGAYSHWRAGLGEINVDDYAAWVREWCQHPGFDWCLIPDVIDGTEDDNERMLGSWLQTGLWKYGVPVWHMHESLGRLARYVNAFSRVALGSSGEYAEIGDDKWWHRMHEAMEVACDENGRPKAKLHGLRMLSPTVFSHVPLASADSTNVAINIGLDSRWTGSYQPVTKSARALILAERIERHVSSCRWNRPAYGTQMNLELIG